MKDGRIFFTFSIRFYGSGCGIESLDPRHPEKGIKFEGTILFDYDDGLYRNDLAPHIYYDDYARFSLAYGLSCCGICECRSPEGVPS
jgi:hypothetical protein